MMKREELCAGTKGKMKQSKVGQKRQSRWGLEKGVIVTNGRGFIASLLSVTIAFCQSYTIDIRALGKERINDTILTNVVGESENNKKKRQQRGKQWESMWTIHVNHIFFAAFHYTYVDSANGRHRIFSERISRKGIFLTFQLAWNIFLFLRHVDHQPRRAISHFHTAERDLRISTDRGGWI